MRSANNWSIFSESTKDGLWGWAHLLVFTAEHDADAAQCGWICTTHQIDSLSRASSLSWPRRTQLRIHLWRSPVFAPLQYSFQISCITDTVQHWLWLSFAVAVVSTPQTVRTNKTLRVVWTKALCNVMTHINHVVDDVFPRSGTNVGPFTFETGPTCLLMYSPFIPGLKSEMDVEAAGRPMIIFGLTDDHTIVWLLDRVCDILVVCNVMPRWIVD